MIPAREVGGDLYDFFRLDDDRLFFMIGDVAGKGLSASIFMAVSKALCKSTALRSRSATVGELVSAANGEVARDNSEMLFVTAFVGILDLATGQLEFCTAGHDNPYLLHADQPAPTRLVDPGGPPLCVVDGFDYPSAGYRMRAGERLCLVSDGVTEARDRAGGMYGSQRLATLLQANAQAAVPARAIVDAVCADVAAFATGADAADDMTVMVLCWRGPGPAPER
jgi:serine phosphatase RsbU (regulator of sigma subunit)